MGVESELFDKNFVESIDVHKTLICDNGEVIVIASAVADKVDENKTVSGKEESKPLLPGKQEQHRYESELQFAFIRFEEGITACIMPCKNDYE